MLVGASAAPVSADPGLESAVDSLRRLLSELLEKRQESIMGELVGIRHELAVPDPARAAAASGRLDKLLEQMGATRFEARPMEYMDPLIHRAVAERGQADLPDGVVVETVCPGYRSARGVILAKAGVAVNRRS